MKRLLVIDDHALVREGMVQALFALGEVGEVVEAEDAESAWKILSQGQAFDLILLDLILPGMGGLSFVGMLRAHYPKVPVLVVSALDRQVVGRAVRRGIAGFVPKSSSSQALLDAVCVVLRGGTVSQRASSQTPIRPSGDTKAVPVQHSQFEFGLTGAQARVLELLAHGKTNREIADSLGLAEGTVKLHVSAIFRALNVSNRAQALLAVARSGQRL